MDEDVMRLRSIGVDVSKLSTEAADRLMKELKALCQQRLEQAEWHEKWQKQEEVHQQMKLEVDRERQKDAAEISLGDTAAAVGESDATLEGFVLFYINVGMLPPFAAEALIERMKKNLKPVLKRLPPTIASLFLPTRTGDTCVELCQWKTKPTKVEQLEALKFAVMSQNPELIP